MAQRPFDCNSPHIVTRSVSEGPAVGRPRLRFGLRCRGDWQQHLLRAYLLGTLPFRVLDAARRRRAGRSPVVVLFYHRVADEHPNAWTISNRQFERHLDWLAPRFDFVSLEEAQRRIRCGNNSRPAVSITFDDGYADNCMHALPLLIKRRIPCTYFVTTHNAISGEPFAHDVAAGQPLPPNSSEQLRALAAAGIEIGGHTHTHADLGMAGDTQTLFYEMVDGAGRLEEVIERPVRYFAAPFGMPENLSAAVFSMARRHGFDAVCSAYGGYNFPGDDPFHLQRIHGDPDFVRFRNWMTIDPRKLSIPRFEYEIETHDVTESLVTS